MLKQEQTNNNMKNQLIIGIGYKKHSGKDTLAGLIAEEYGAHNCDILHFADALYREISDATGVSVDQIKADKHIFRPLLQWWGTEFRKKYQCNERYWLDYLDREMSFNEKEVLLIPDVRFYTEVQFVRNLGGKLLRVFREGSLTNDTHPSETELDNYHGWDMLVSNNSSIEHLRHQAKGIVATLIRPNLPVKEPSTT